MKTLITTALLAGAMLFTGCETVAVVDRRPSYGYSHATVHYEHDRPYYYSSGRRYSGYPSGYRGQRRSYSEYNVERNVEINRNTVINRNVYVNRNRPQGQVGQVHRNTNVEYRNQGGYRGKPGNVQEVNVQKKKKKNVRID